MKKVVTITGFISGIITILGFIQQQISKNAILALITYICGGVAILSIISIFIANRNIRYWLCKQISYYITRNPHLKYYVKEKDVIYTYKDISNLQYRKTTYLIAQSDGFSSYTGKFRWSKQQPLDAFQVKCCSEHTGMYLGREATWNTYTVHFSPAPKNSERVVDILLDNLNDPNHEALPYCSCSIVERTQCIKMTVKLEGGLKFDLDKVRYLVYNNSASLSPILEKAYDKNKNCRINYDSTCEQITIEEMHPIYGYKYKLKWDFQR